MTRAGTEPAVSCTLNQAGDRPRPAIQRASSGAQITPSRQPRAEPATPTRAASARTIRATCRGVAPTVRSRARSRRRWATERPNAEAITVIATKRGDRGRDREEGGQAGQFGGVLHGVRVGLMPLGAGQHLQPGQRGRAPGGRRIVGHQRVDPGREPGRLRVGEEDRLLAGPRRNGSDDVKDSGPPAVSTVTGRPRAARPATTISPSVLGGWPELRR